METMENVLSVIKDISVILPLFALKPRLRIALLIRTCPIAPLVTLKMIIWAYLQTPVALLIAWPKISLSVINRQVNTPLNALNALLVQQATIQMRQVLASKWQAL